MFDGGLFVCVCFVVVVVVVAVLIAHAANWRK